MPQRVIPLVYMGYWINSAFRCGCGWDCEWSPLGIWPHARNILGGRRWRGVGAKFNILGRMLCWSGMWTPKESEVEWQILVGITKQPINACAIIHCNMQATKQSRRPALNLSTCPAAYVHQKLRDKLPDIASTRWNHFLGRCIISPACNSTS